jgi:hypothetical protein
MIKITKNGEITYDETTRLYTVWDETYAEEVGSTGYLEVAKAMLHAYCVYYLEVE